MEKEVTVRSIKPAHEDDRGMIMDILDDIDAQHIGLITSKAGCVRGNHYHEKAEQFNFILSGKANFYWKDTRDPEAKVHKLELNKWDFVSIPTHIIHTVEAVEDLEFLDINTVSRSDEGYEKDVYRVDPLEKQQWSQFSNQ